MKENYYQVTLRKHLLRVLLTVSEVWSMIIMVGNIAAGTSGTGAVFESYILIHRLRERDWARHGLLK